MSHAFARVTATIVCRTERGDRIRVPVCHGLLKHPSPDQLSTLLRDPVVLRKYTQLALQRAPWTVLRRFPAEWLLECLGAANVRPGRRAALEFLLAPELT